MKKLMMGLIISGMACNAFAVSVTVTNTTCSIGASNCDALDAEIRNAIGEDLPDASIGAYGEGTANAGAFAQRGLTSDYSDKFDIVAVKGGFGLAVSGDMDAPETADGIGLGGAASIGLNLGILPVEKVGPVELDKMDVFISFLSQNMDQTSTDTTISGDISSFGLMARYHILEGKDFVPGNMLSWGGVYIHTGIQRSSLEASVTSSFDNVEVDTGSNTATIEDTTAGFSFESSNTSIPFEVSTYLRTVWAFTFFGGLGFDYILSGSTDVDLNASGTATGTGYGANISASESDSADATATNFRAFGGLQLNLPFVRFTAHLNKGLGSDLMGFNAGIKILY